MAKLTSDVSNTLKGRITNQKLGGRAKKPFYRSGWYPSPSTNPSQKKGKRGG